jgi:hypothetical protein
MIFAGSTQSETPMTVMLQQDQSPGHGAPFPQPSTRHDCVWNVSQYVAAVPAQSFGPAHDCLYPSGGFLQMAAPEDTAQNQCGSQSLELLQPSVLQ